jgi:hypothetical protein
MSSPAPERFDTIGATFHLFPKLPPELRFKIWGLAARQPRDVEVRAGIVKAKDNTKHAQFRSVSPAPAVLHANQESREECLKMFVKCLPERSTTNQRIYINPELDLLIVKTAYDLLGVHLHEWQRTKTQGLGIPKNHSQIPHPSDSWTQPRGLWTIINPEGKRWRGGRDCVILAKMFEHHSVLEHNTDIDVGHHFKRLDYGDYGRQLKGVWAMGSWNRSWELVLGNVER